MTALAFSTSTSNVRELAPRSRRGMTRTAAGAPWLVSNAR